MSLNEEIVQAGKHLGQKSEYSKTYDKSLLVRVERKINRDRIGYTDNVLPFIGFDIWNAYEVSYLLDNGLPTTFVAKIVYTSTNKYIVESKSLKLYLNSFNGTKFGKYSDSVITVTDIITKDLSELLECDVSVILFSENSNISLTNKLFSDSLLEDKNNVIIDKYTEDRDLIEGIERDVELEKTYSSHLLKSNCLITKQPDWGSIFIKIKGKNLPTDQSLLKYIVSFRDECHFHEEIVEAIFYSLFYKLQPTKLIVCAQYLRRGGIDINPIRFTPNAINDYVIESLQSNNFLNRTLRQ